MKDQVEYEVFKHDNATLSFEYENVYSDSPIPAIRRKHKERGRPLSVYEHISFAAIKRHSSPT